MLKFALNNLNASYSSGHGLDTPKQHHRKEHSMLIFDKVKSFTGDKIRGRNSTTLFQPCKTSSETIKPGMIIIDAKQNSLSQQNQKREKMVKHRRRSEGSSNLLSKSTHNAKSYQRTNEEDKFDGKDEQFNAYDLTKSKDFDSLFISRQQHSNHNISFIDENNSVTSTTNKPHYFQSENSTNKICNNPNKQINRSACFDPNMTLTSLSSSSYEKKYFKSPFLPSITHDSKNTKISEESLYVTKSNVCDNEKTRDYRIHLSKSPLQIDRYTPTPPQSNSIYPGMMAPLNSNLALPNIVSNNEIEDRSNSSLFLGPTSSRVAQEIFVEKRDSGYLTNNDQGSTISSDLSSTQSSGPPRRWRQPQQISLSLSNSSGNTNLNSRTITNDQCISDKLYVSSSNYFSNDMNLKSPVIPIFKNVGTENQDYTSLPRGNYEALADTSYLYLKNFAIPNTSQIVPMDMKNSVGNSRNRIENLKIMNSPSKLITTCAKLPQDPNLTWATNNDAPNSTKYFDMNCPYPQKSLVPDYPSDQETNSDCDEKCFTLSKETQNLMNQAEIAANSNDASTALCLYTTAQERARQAMDVHEADPNLISQARVLYNKCQLLTRQLSQLFATQNHTISCNNDENLHSNTELTAEPYQNNPLLEEEKEELIAKDSCSSFDQFSKSLILHRSKEMDIPRSSHLPSVTSFKSSNITSFSSKSIVPISANLNMSTVSIQSFIPSPIKKSMDNTMPSTVIKQSLINDSERSNFLDCTSQIVPPNLKPNQISSKDTFESVATKRRISERIQKFESKSSLALGIDATIHKIITPNSQTKSNIQNNQDMIDSTNIYGTIPRSMIKKKGALTKNTKTTTNISNQIISPFKSSFSKINGPLLNNTTHDALNVSTAQNTYDIRRRSLTHQTVLADLGNLDVLKTNHISYINNSPREKTNTTSHIIPLSNCRGLNSKIPTIPCGVMPKEIIDNTISSVSNMDQSLESSIYNKPLEPNNFYVTKECNESIATSPSKTPKKYHFLQELIETSSPPLTSLKNLSPLKKFTENSELFLNNQLLPYTKLDKMVTREEKMAHKDATIKFNPPNTDGITNRTGAYKNNQWGGLSQTKTSYISYSPCQIDNGLHSQTSNKNINENTYVTFSSTSNNHHQTSLFSHIDITKTKLSVSHKGHSSKLNIGNEINLANNLIQPPLDIMSQSYHTNNSSSNALKMEILNKSPNSFTKHSSDHQKKLIFNSNKHIQTLAKTSKDEASLSFGSKNKKSAIPGYENIRCHTPPYQYFVRSCPDEGGKNLLLQNNRKSDIFYNTPIINNESKKDTDDGNKMHEPTFLALNRPKIWTSGAPKPYTSGMREKLLNTSLNPSTPTSSSKEMMSTHNKLYVRPDSLIFPTSISADLLHGNKTKYEDDNYKYGENSNGFTSTRNNNNNYNFGKTASNNTYATRTVETFEKMLSPSSCPHPVAITNNSNNLNRTQNHVNGNERKSMTPISIVTCEKCLKIFPSQSPNKSLTNHRRLLCQKCLITTLSSPTY